MTVRKAAVSEEKKPIPNRCPTCQGDKFVITGQFAGIVRDFGTKTACPTCKKCPTCNDEKLVLAGQFSGIVEGFNTKIPCPTCSKPKEPIRRGPAGIPC